MVKQRKCSHCSKNFPRTAKYFYVSYIYKKTGKAILHPECKKCSTKRTVKYGRKNPIKRRLATLKNRFGINIEQYEDILKKQKFRCAICNRHQDEFDRRLAIDHVHDSTKRIRGLLCSSCNQGIGNFHDNIKILKKAIGYLYDNKNSLHFRHT
jgi:hypothetical protein